MVLYVLIILILTIMFFEAVMHYQQIIHKITGSKRDIPTPFFIINKIKSICNTIVSQHQKKFVFIDIGCGDGITLKTLCGVDIFNKCIGIEINKKIYDVATANLKNTTIELHNLDALDYKFRIQPTIIYLYEPFHDVEYDTAMSLYHKLFEKIKNLCESTLYIVYVSSSQFNRRDLHQNKGIFSQHGFEIINTYNIGSIIYRRFIYVAKCV